MRCMQCAGQSSTMVHPVTDDYHIKSICLPGAMAAGIASRYKTGLRLDTGTVNR